PTGWLHARKHRRPGLSGRPPRPPLRARGPRPAHPGPRSPPPAPLRAMLAAMPEHPVTRLDLFTVSPRGVPAAVARMATDRLRLRRLPGLTFTKLLGTGDGRTFDARDADLRRWGVLTVWATRAHAAAFGSPAGA